MIIRVVSLNDEIRPEQVLECINHFAGFIREAKLKDPRKSILDNIDNIYQAVADHMNCIVETIDGEIVFDFIKKQESIVRNFKIRAEIQR